MRTGVGGGVVEEPWFSQSMRQGARQVNEQGGASKGSLGGRARRPPDVEKPFIAASKEFHHSFLKAKSDSVPSPPPIDQAMSQPLGC